MQYFPNGSQFAVSAGLAAAVSVSLANGPNPLITELGEDPILAANDYVIIESAWGGINGRASRLKTAAGAGGGLELLGVDTTDTTRYPADTAETKLVRANEFFGLSQITGLDKTGGDQQFFTWAYLNDPSGQQFQRPTRKNARSMTMNLDYDPDLPWYKAMIALDEAQRTSVLRITLPTGDQLLYNAFVSFNADPTMEMDTNMQNIATFSPMGQVIRIPAA